MQRLRPYLSQKWTYIDAMCSKQPGVGRLLVLHAYHLALPDVPEVGRLGKEVGAAQPPIGLIAQHLSGLTAQLPI